MIGLNDSVLPYLINRHQVFPLMAVFLFNRGYRFCLYLMLNLRFGNNQYANSLFSDFRQNLDNVVLNLLLNSC